jgi:quinoprotein glucose dehydrogenase
VPFLSEKGVPCVKPPWGSTIAIDTATGKELWRRPLGSLAAQIPLIGSLFNVGTPGSGGTLQTATGLVFTAFSTDERIRALDVRTGEEIWTAQLPFSAHATPMSFRLAPNEKQYLVIATGGAAAMDPKVGNTLVAFTLAD